MEIFLWRKNAYKKRAWNFTNLLVILNTEERAYNEI